MRTLNVILEIAAHPNGRDYRAFANAISALEHSSIGEHKILRAHVDQHADEPTHIPGFGHNYRCNDKCRCDVRPYGVKRYFNVTLFVDGEPESDILQTYLLAGTNDVRVDVCGLHGPIFDGERDQLRPLVQVVAA